MSTGQLDNSEEQRDLMMRGEAKEESSPFGSPPKPKMLSLESLK